MYSRLYSYFQHWYHGGEIFFYSDTHFADKDMADRRGISDEEQVKRINSKIGKKDTIIFLGDVTNKDNIEAGLALIKQIRGYKVLIMGNHDKGATVYTDYFDEVCSGILTISDNIILSHEPIDSPYALNIHGHEHSGSLNKDDHHFNVCAEHIDYTPVPLNYIIKRGYLKDIESIHRNTIDRATERKNRKKIKNS